MPMDRALMQTVFEIALELTVFRDKRPIMPVYMHVK